jgi:chromosome segregation ATPase
MSPDAEKQLDEHEKRLNAVELQAALDKQSRQNMHRSIDAMNMTLANLGVDLKTLLEDYHDNKSNLRLFEQNMKAMAAQLTDLTNSKASKADVAAVADHATKIEARQDWALGTAITALLGLVVTALKVIIGRPG